MSQKTRVIMGLTSLAVLIASLVGLCVFFRFVVVYVVSLWIFVLALSGLLTAIFYNGDTTQSVSPE